MTKDYQLKAGLFPPFWLYGNSTIKQNQKVVNGLRAVHNTRTAGTPFPTDKRYEVRIMTRTLQEILTTEKPEVVKKAKAMASEMLLNIHLAELRERAELTQKEFAGAMGVKQPTIAGMEKVGQDIKLSSLKKYIEVTGGRLRIDVEMSDGSHFGFSV